MLSLRQFFDYMLHLAGQGLEKLRQASLIEILPPTLVKDEPEHFLQLLLRRPALLIERGHYKTN